MAATRSSDPVKIKKVGPQELAISWSDGHESRYNATRLRGLCPCAVCKDEMTGVRLVLPIHIPADIEFRKIDLVGQYALQFHYSDGHHTGIYSFEYLRELEETGTAGIG